MKFTPENLLQIYLDGSFTEEAQAEFDKLMRKDPVFSEQVTKAVAERLGPAPDSIVDGVATRLDGKMEALWNKNKPSPYRPLLRKAAWFALIVLFAGSLYLGEGYLKALVHSVIGSFQGFSSRPEGLNSTEAVTAGNGSNEGVSGSEATRAGKASQPKPLSQSPARVGKESGSRPGSSKGPETLPAKAALGKSENSPALSSHQSSASQDAAAAGSGSPQVSVRESSPAKEHSTSALAPVGTKTEEGFPLLIPVEIDKAQKVVISVMDAQGFPVRQLYAGVWAAGTHTVQWDGKDGFGNLVAPGNYSIVLNAGGKTMTRSVNVPAP